jgi:anti-sigma regulatory factor (Ser/Thr protein kinase)
MNELILEARMENMEAVQDFVSARIADCPLKVQNQIGIAVDEIFSNIARYAYRPGVGGATVRIAVEDTITIEFEDSGEAFDPLSLADPDITLSAEERKIGGLGLFLVKNLMDSIAYRRVGKKNILTLQKRLARG